MDYNETIARIAKRPLLEFGMIFNNSLTLFKEVWVQGFVTLLLTFLCMIPMYAVAYLPLLTMGIWNPEMLQEEEPSALLVVTLIAILPILLIGAITLSLALMAAFLKICKSRDLNLGDHDDYFYFFKNGRLRKLVVLAAMYLGISLLGFLVCGLGMIYLVVPLSLVPAFVAFHEEWSAKEIVQASFQLGNKNWLVIFGLLILLGFIAELGVFLCLVGVLFTAMLAKVPVYYIYKDGVGFGGESEQDS